MLAALLVAAPLLLALAGPAVATTGAPGGDDHGGGPAAVPAGGLAQQSFDADAVVLDVDVDADGTAAWTVRYRLDIGTQNRSEAFESLRADIRQNTSAYVADFRSRIRQTVAAAENATGRPMSATNFSVRTRTEQLSESGFVTYAFRWTGFAAVDGEVLRAGDAVGGLFLDERTTLSLSFPADRAVRSVTPEPTRREEAAVVWTGRRSFDADEPRLVVGPPRSGLPQWLPLVGIGALLVGLGGGLAYVLRGRDTGEAEHTDTPAGATPPTTEDADATGAGDGAQEAAAGDTGAEPDDGSEEEQPADQEDRPPAELLSNEERVVRLLEDRGGRVKQQDVVSALDWTEAKTSQVVTDMREAGDVEVFRIGRENVIKLPDAELTDGESGDGEDGAGTTD